MEYLKYNGNTDESNHRIMVNLHNIPFLDINGKPYSLVNKQPDKKVEYYLVELDSFRNSNEEHIRFYMNPAAPSVIVVLNETLDIEKVYAIGKLAYLSQGAIKRCNPVCVTTFYEVINAYKNEAISFH